MRQQRAIEEGTHIKAMGQEDTTPKVNQSRRDKPQESKSD